jgi:hypothetical protein
MAHCNNKLILYIIIKEKGESYNLYVYVGDVTMPTPEVIEYSQNFLQADQPIRLQYSNQIKLFKEYLKLLNRLYDITWFGSVYAEYFNLIG